MTKVALNVSGVVSKHSSPESLVQDYIKSLSLDLLDDECVNTAKEMATMYTAIAAFENMVRKFGVKILLEHKGENWWDGTGTFYDFQSRLWLSDDDNLSPEVHPPKEKPRKPEKRGKVPTCRKAYRQGTFRKV